MADGNNAGMRRKTGARALFVVMLIFAVAATGATGYLGVSGSLEGRSALSKFAEVIFEVFMDGDSYVSEEKTLKTIERRRKANEKYRVSAIYETLFDFETDEHAGFQVCYFRREGAENTFVYFHGGSYMWQPLIFHFDYCDYLADELNANVIMPIYPKAPEYGYSDALEWLDSLYSEIILEETVEAFFGDSAGGGLLLSFARYLADRGSEVPADLIAFSPCLDLSLSNPEIADFAPVDPMLNTADLRVKLSTYVKDGAYDDPYVSPLYCDYSDLGEVTLFAGTREILLPDIRVLDRRLTEEGISHFYYEYPNQNHTFSIFPMPERRLCLEQIKLSLAS